MRAKSPSIAESFVIAESAGRAHWRVRPRRSRRSGSAFVDTKARRASWSSVSASTPLPVNKAAAFRKSSYPLGFGSGCGGGVRPTDKKSTANIASSKTATNASRSVRAFRSIANGQHDGTTGAVNDLHVQHGPGGRAEEFAQRPPASHLSI